MELFHKIAVSSLNILQAGSNPGTGHVHILPGEIGQYLRGESNKGLLFYLRCSIDIPFSHAHCKKGHRIEIWGAWWPQIC